ncbi:CDP-glycerol glycerophosphotransferase family protein [Litoreibacter ascidiaceicola]|uniref:CDP-glycerol glycerophosphotransferase family protein n=1 Tax=Litoreibacter ascidiaceicola TaxID=1486859 RepID=UPI001587C5A8|nr:CDP-glycerol glycerophosphotransferase family protein [Litoreibacter ascidiaceicola]
MDDYVLDYLRDLSQHADIYYLADCPIDKTQMAKLDGLVKGAWAQRHGAYDFGSYSMLARDLVGWDVIETYDEMILANDSCYLVHPLAETFREMASRPCAWWGLQATKGLISTAHQNKIPTEVLVPMTDIKKTYLAAFETDVLYDFLVGSYFLAFRKSVINDQDFRRILDNVTVEQNKLRIIRKYEIGITRFLIGKGYEFDTLVGSVSKQQPIFTQRAFDLIDDGFPLLKRYFLAENHYKMPGLAQWKSRVLQANPAADVDSFERNLLRVSNASKLYRNFRIGQNKELSKTPRTHTEMEAEDLETPKYDHWWAFPVCCHSHLFSDNNRAVFEQVKNDPNVKKIILTRNVHVEVEGVNTVVVPLQSYEGQTYLLRARQVFLRHGVRANVGYPLSSDLHNFHNLWHGIPLKRIGYTSLDQTRNLDDMVAENKRLKSVIAASKVDRLAMAAAYWPLTYHDIWVTGLPRHDFILAPESQLPSDFKSRTDFLNTRLKGKKFVLFAPTFRADQENGYYSFSEDEVRELADWLTKNDMIMGIREHMADKTRLYSSQLQGECFMDASERLFPDIELLYRKADLLLTDYSSCFIDFMLTGRPMISFAFDQDSYTNTERGLFYEQEMVFPGPICTDFSQLMRAFRKSIQPVTESERQSYVWKTRFFHTFHDDQNSERLVSKVKATYEGSDHMLMDQDVRPVKKGRRITFVYSPNNNITNRYRIYNLMEHLCDAGWACQAVNSKSLKPEILEKSGILFICRIPLADELIDICESFKLGGGKIIFDLDDLIHDIKAFSQSEYFRKRPEFSSDFTVLSEQTRQMIETVDAVTVTTPALMRTIKPFNKPVTVIPNSISTALSRKYHSIPERNSDKIRICYLSGTATHSEDFAQCRDALIAMLQKHPQAELHVVGKMGIDEANVEEPEFQFIRHHLMSYEAMQEFLSGMDINLAPLSPSVFNDAKSELKIFEAALHGVATIASPTESYAAAIDNGQNGFLASTPADWEAALDRLITSAQDRNRIGRAAFNEIAPRFSAAGAAKTLLDVLNGLLKP